MLDRIMNKVFEREREILDSVPDMEELEAILKSLKTRKSLGLDGLTMEVLCHCWEWVSEECLEVIRAFWQDDILIVGAARGVTKLIPKIGELEFLKNWRPIMMLMLIYKFISKILALCLQPFMSFPVDKERTGFIKGYKIIDNILALKIGKEYVKFKKLLTLVLKLDFMKAYDRLDHFFLRDVLGALGFVNFSLGLIWS